jgi:hypothetical protein
MQEEVSQTTEENTAVKRANYYVAQIAESFPTKRDLLNYLNARGGLGEGQAVIRGLEVKPEVRQVFDFN